MATEQEDVKPVDFDNLKEGAVAPSANNMDMILDIPVPFLLNLAGQRC